MSLASVPSITDSGMNVRSTRLNTVASNITSTETVSSSVNKTYHARHPVFSTMSRQTRGDNGSLFVGQDSSGADVQILGVIEDQSSLMPRYEPNHPTADANGYVCYPSVNVVEEMAGMISTSRAFRTSAEVMNTAKQMIQGVLTLGQ